MTRLSPVIMDLIPDGNRVLPLFHGRRLYDLDPIRVIEPHGTVLKLKGGEAEKSVFRFPFTCKLLTGKEYRFLCRYQPLTQPVNHVVSVIRSFHAGHEKRMIAAGRRANRRNRGETAKPVGQKAAGFLTAFQSLKILFPIYKLHRSASCMVSLFFPIITAETGGTMKIPEYVSLCGRLHIPLSPSFKNASHSPAGSVILTGRRRLL